jgi:hypothetical protein
VFADASRGGTRRQPVRFRLTGDRSMTRKPLTRYSKPYTTPEYEIQATEAARKRRAQMVPGNAPPTAPGEDPVSDYQGAAEDVVLGPEPFILSGRIKGSGEAKPVETGGAAGKDTVEDDG